jgi:hypothetical protein
MPDDVLPPWPTRCPIRASLGYRPASWRASGKVLGGAQREPVHTEVFRGSCTMTTTRAAPVAAGHRSAAGGQPPAHLPS